MAKSNVVELGDDLPRVGIDRGHPVCVLTALVQLLVRLVTTCRLLVPSPTSALKTPDMLRPCTIHEISRTSIYWAGKYNIWHLEAILKKPVRQHLLSR